MEAHESTSKLLESILPRSHEDDIAEKGFYSTNHNQFGAQIYSDVPSDENSGCDGSSGQGMEEARNDKSLAIGQDEEQKGRHSGSTKRKKESPLAALMGICH